MTHYRPPGSIDDLLLKTINLLSATAIKAATGKAYDTFSVISRPINDMGLHLEDAIKLDHALVDGGHPMIFGTYYADQFSECPPPAPKNIALPDRLLKIMGEVGAVAAAVEHALAPDSESGASLSINERREIARQAYEAKEQIAALLQAVTPP